MMHAFALATCAKLVVFVSQIVCLSAGLLKKLWVNVNENLGRGRAWDKKWSI